jgi:hypothetical protein
MAVRGNDDLDVFGDRYHSPLIVALLAARARRVTVYRQPVQLFRAWRQAWNFPV